MDASPWRFESSHPHRQRAQAISRRPADIFLIGAIVTLVSAVLTLVLIRDRELQVGATSGPQPAVDADQSSGAPLGDPAQSPVKS